MSKTKNRILEAAILLFNQYGYSNISMQKLSNELNVSPGNLTYHYPKKEDLMLALYDLFQKEISLILPSEEENKPDLFNFDQQIRAFYDLQQRFLFFYLDLLEIERSYPIIAEKHYEHIRKQIRIIRAGLQYSESLGLLNPEPDEKTYDFLAEHIWFTAVFWPRQVRVRGLDDKLENLRIVQWQHIKPYLTSKGHAQLFEVFDKTNSNIQNLTQA